MESYNFKKIEKKWQKYWEKNKLFQAKDFSKKPKYYCLVEFPYTSGEGLHTGHTRSYTAMDIISRKRRMEGYNVLFPMGWDAFGLPTENYAIKTGIQPQVITKKSIDNFRRQIKSLGLSFDWGREINTTDPNYYKWTQWIFLQFYKKGLAYKKKMPINWCLSCKIGLANEEVIDGKCERCGGATEKREKEQWMLAITKYADRLLKDLDKVDYLEKIKIEQKNWIGKSEGTEIEFPVVLNKNTNFLILHGYTGLPNKNFIPWLKKQLEDRGYKVQAPEMPNTNNPSEKEQVAYVLDNCRIDENTILIGHSLGGVVAMKALSQRNKPIQGLILIASAVDPLFPEDLDREERPFWKNFKWDFNYDRIKKLALLRTVLSDLQEKKRIAYLEFLSEKLDAKLITGTAKREHFCALEEPIILENILPKIKVFTTRPDTIFGATYMVLAPEHEIIRQLAGQISNLKEIESYIKSAKRKSELQRTDLAKEKTGVELKGIKAINPATKKEIPVFVADYVLSTYGTGAIMAVPAHDERDYKFAKRYHLEIKNVIDPVTTDVQQKKPEKKQKVVALVENRKREILTINWGKQGGRLLIGGTIKGNENPITTAKREIIEETGYDDLEFVEIGKETVHHEYFSYARNKAYIASTKPVYFHLRSAHRKSQGLEDHENGKFKVEWVTKEQAGKEIHDSLHQYVFHKFIIGDFYEGDGIINNSGKFNGMNSEKAKWEITKFVGGKKEVQYHLRDWIFSRQHYWGEPIPIIHCDKCGDVPVPEKDLPVKLPEVKKYQPTDTGESPLANIKNWVNTKCPVCKGPAKRETDTMPNWAGSSWYFLRYIDPHNNKELASQKKLKYWMGINWYNGGMEHTTLHLLYSRFWDKFLYDIGISPVSEPYQKRTSQGMILGEDKEKMSKSRGNVINPDEIVRNFGADAYRIYQMFMGPFDQAIPWDSRGIEGARRFLNKVWNLKFKIDLKFKIENLKLETLLHQTIKKVTEDIETMKFNTAISSLMILVNEFEKQEKLHVTHYALLVTLLSPFAPHIANELAERLGVKISEWPKYDPKKIKENIFELVVQINGKVRDRFEVLMGISQKNAQELTLKRENVKKYLSNKKVKKVIFVPNRLINYVCSWF